MEISPSKSFCRDLLLSIIYSITFEWWEDTKQEKKSIKQIKCERGSADVHEDVLYLRLTYYSQQISSWPCQHDEQHKKNYVLMLSLQLWLTSHPHVKERILQTYLFFQTFDDIQEQILLLPQFQGGEDNVHVMTKLLPSGDGDRTVTKAWQQWPAG